MMFYPAQYYYRWLSDHAEGWQFGEQGIIEALLDRIGTQSAFCVEIGAGDGESLPVTVEPLIESGWQALLFEADPAKKGKLRRKFWRQNKIGRVHIYGTFNNQTPLFQCRPDVLVLDVDGAEYKILQNLIKVHEVPRILIVEHFDMGSRYCPQYAWVPPACMAGEFITDGSANWCLQATAEAIQELTADRYHYIGFTRVNSILLAKDAAISPQSLGGGGATE